MATKYDPQIDQLGNTVGTLLGKLSELAGPMKELRSAEEALGLAAQEMSDEEVIEVIRAILNLAFELAVRGNPVTKKNMKERAVRAAVKVLSPLPPHETGSTLLDITD